MHAIWIAIVIAMLVLMIAGGFFGLSFYKDTKNVEKFQPGYELERDIKGYGATLGDKRSMTAQNFGIDDSLAGVFSARILTPWDYYARIRQHNMKMAKTAQCKLACAS